MKSHTHYYIKVVTNSIVCDAIAIKAGFERAASFINVFLNEIHGDLIQNMRGTPYVWCVPCVAHLIPCFTWDGTGQRLWHSKPGLEYTLDGNLKTSLISI